MKRSPKINILTILVCIALATLCFAIGGYFNYAGFVFAAGPFVYIVIAAIISNIGTKG